MAKATVIITCKHCGQTFEHSKICGNRKDANGYEAWALEHIDTCPDCIRRQREERNAAIAAELGLPQIVGVSERQINYAASRRNAYAAKHQDSLAKFKALFDRIEAKDPELVANIARAGADWDESVEALKKQRAIDYLVIRESNAGKLLDSGI